MHTGLITAIMLIILLNYQTDISKRSFESLKPEKKDTSDCENIIGSTWVEDSILDMNSLKTYTLTKEKFMILRENNDYYYSNTQTPDYPSKSQYKIKNCRLFHFAKIKSQSVTYYEIGLIIKLDKKNLIIENHDSKKRIYYHRLDL